MIEVHPTSSTGESQVNSLGHVTSRLIPSKAVHPMPARSRWVFDDLLDRRFLKPRYEPIVDLMSGVPVGAEAMARWPELGILPGSAHQWAVTQGRLAELDEACRNAAIDDAIDRGLASPLCLFVNLDPSVIGPGTAARLLERVVDHAALVVEIIGPAGMGRSTALLRTVEQLRESGCAIALEDAGACVGGTLAPSIEPDIIKLDVSVVQGRSGDGDAALAAGICSYADRTGAAVLAEGIATEAHLHRALAFGATLGEGWYFSRWTPLGT